ncbi:MAG: DUF5667 domain-containing protein [Dehalococcoidia bacterium]|nr:DUF5667 domain-containing protein [Dehalococcoidia bacterium]
MKRQQEEFTQVLDQCLDNVIQEGATVESCLQRYPQHAAQLRPLLTTALETRRTLDFTSNSSAKDRARLALQTALRQRNARPRRSVWGLLVGVSAQLLVGPRRWAVATAAAVALLVVVGGTGMVAASSESVPGQPLYQVKRAVEQVRLTTTFNNQAKAQLHASLASRRSQELAVVAARGDTKRADRLAIEAEQQLQQVQDNALPGLPVTVTQVAPGPELNAPPQELIDEMKLLKLDVADKRSLQALQRRLEIEQKVQDKVFQEQMRKSPEPARKGLEAAQQATRQKYQAMLQAVKWLAEEDTSQGDTK